MENYTNKVAIVTGSSSGIGAGISKALAQRGCIVIGLARRREKLQTLSEEINQTSGCKGRFHFIQCNIADEQDLGRAFEKIKSDYGVPSILVNNAGVIRRDKFLDLDGAKFDSVVETNAKALLLATRYAVKFMSENSVTGHILNVNSIAAYIPVLHETYLLYTASKNMVKVFTEGIRENIRENGWNIKISSISPGFVKTAMIEDTPAQFITKMPKILSVEDVVKACIFILDTPLHVQITELIITPLHQIVK